MTKPRDTKRPEDGAKPGRVTSDLASRIARAQSQRPGMAGADGRQPMDMTGAGRGFRMASEFVAAILVGTAIGYLLDQWLKTSPWLTLVMLMIGFAAGVLNVTRTVAEMNKAAPAPPDADLGPGDDEDDDK